MRGKTSFAQSDTIARSSSFIGDTQGISDRMPSFSLPSDVRFCRKVTRDAGLSDFTQTTALRETVCRHTIGNPEHSRIRFPSNVIMTSASCRTNLGALTALSMN